MNKNKVNIEAGFGLIEFLVALAIFLIIVVTGSSTVVRSFTTNRLGEEETNANLIAQEGIDAVRSIKNRGISGLVVGNHGLDNSSGQWILSGSSETIGDYTRTIVIEPAKRDTAGNFVDSGGNIDCDTWKITSRVNWDFTPSRNNEVKLVTYLSNYSKPVFPSGWETPVTLGSYNLSGTDDGLRVKSLGTNYVYFLRSSGTNEFSIFDVSNPSAPILRGTTIVAGTPTDMEVVGTLAFLSTTDNSAELVILDVSNPLITPPVLSTVNLPGVANALGVFAVGNYAYVTRASSSSDEFVIIDITNITSPVILGSIGLASNSNDISVSGSYAYLVNDADSQEVQVIDISNPISPVLVGSLDLLGSENAETIDVFGSCLAVGRDSLGNMHTIDVSDPTTPKNIASYASGAPVRDIDVTLSQDRVILGNSLTSGEIQIVDISNLASPSLGSNINAPGNVNGVAFDPVNNRIYAASVVNTSEFIVIGQ